MNIIFFGNEKFKNILDDCYNNINYVYYQIESYRDSKVAKHIQGDIDNDLDSLIFVPYFLYSWCESEGNLELNTFIANEIHLLPGKHVICMFTDLRNVDITSISFAYQEIIEYLNKLGDNYFYLDEYSYISISRGTKNWVNNLNNGITLISSLLTNLDENLVLQKDNVNSFKILKKGN